MVFVENHEKQQPEYFCSYSGRLTSFLKAFGLSYSERAKNPITGATFCIFERNQKLLDIVEFWSECRNKFKDYDEAGNRIEHEAGDA